MGNHQDSSQIEQIAYQHLGILADSISKLDMKMERFDKMMMAQEKEKTEFTHNDGMEQRFQTIIFSLWQFEKTGKRRQKQIKIWCGQMVKKVFSEGFRRFQNGSISEKQVKSFCSENFLINFLNLCKKTDIQKEQIQMINNTLKFSILPYFKMKYPQSQQAEINLSLNNRIKRIDDSENNDIDLFYKSQVKFQISPEKNYNSKIMEFLNFIIKIPSSIIDQKEQLKDYLDSNNVDKENNLYQNFFSFFEELFQSLTDEQKVQAMKQKMSFDKFIKKKSVKIGEQYLEREKQKTQYKEKVESYTKYLIGRKISQNLKPFTQEQIQSGNMNIRNSSLIRVITKWCGQLKQNFMNPQKVTFKHGQFRMKDGSQRYLSYLQSCILSQLLERRRKYLQQWISSVQKNNFSHQQMFSKRDIFGTSDLQMFSKEESLIGLFSTVTRNNYQSYLMRFLNELIHNLLLVMQEFEDITSFLPYSKKKWNIHKKQEFQELALLSNKSRGMFKKKQNERDDKVPNLFNLKISDLLRCKCSSRELQINALYSQLQRLSNNNPNLLKIVKIKNRLERGTKDILMEILFKNKLVVEVQLAVNSEKSKFIQYSDKFNHYIYEVQRAQFGPISEFCSIWVTNDPRSSFFRKIAQQINKRHITQKKMNFIENEEYQKLTLPFTCDKCRRFYSNPIYVGQNRKYKTGNYCFLCIADELTNLAEVKKIISLQLPECLKKLKEKQYSNIKNVKNPQNFPQFGVTLKLKSKHPKIKFFVSFRKGQKMFLIEKTGNNVFNSLGEITTLSEKEMFLEDNIIFSYDGLKSQASKISEDEVNKSYFIPMLFQEAQISERNSLKVTEQGIQDSEISNIRCPLKAIRKINFSENKLENIGIIAEKFPKANVLVLSKSLLVILEKNNIKSISGLQKFFNLKEVCLQRNQIQCISENIREVSQNNPQLHTLILNKIGVKLIDEGIGSFQQLKDLQLDENNIKQLPLSIGELRNLKKLFLYNNKIMVLPTSFSNLLSLTKLDLSKNQLTLFPEPICKLSNLIQLYLFSNRITQIPNKLDNLSKLEKLSLNENLISIIPSNFDKLKSLTELFLYQNNIASLPESFAQLPKLETLILGKNNFTQIPVCLMKIITLSKISFSSNNLQNIPEQFGNLVHLKQIYLYNNFISSLPISIGNLTLLEVMSLTRNKINSLPSTIGNLVALQQLLLNDNLINDLPESLGNLINLLELWLNSNKLKKLPSTLGSISKLKILSLSKNQISQVPVTIGNLVHLQKLILDHNEIIYLPDSFGKMTKLSKLILHDNKIVKLPDSFGSLQNLKELYLNCNKLTFITEQIGKLVFLENLSLDENQLLRLPHSISKLQNLENLYLQKNQISDLPDQFGALKRLTRLYLHDNKLKSIPQNFGNLKKLERLSLNNNQIQNIAESFGQLQSLKIVYLGSNKLTQIPQKFGNLNNLTSLLLDHNQIKIIPQSFSKLMKLQTVDLSHNHIEHIPESLAKLEKLCQFDISHQLLNESSKNTLLSLLALAKKNYQNKQK